jgi:hypothetical protein
MRGDERPWAGRAPPGVAYVYASDRKRIEVHVLSAERLHGDDTTVPVLAKGKTDTGRIWVYVRDENAHGGAAACGDDSARPASRNRDQCCVLFERNKRSG